MSMLEIMMKITVCLFLAALLGFVIGWLFSALLKNEKMQKKYNTLYEEYELKRSDIKQLKEDLALKDDAMAALEQKYQNCEKARLNAQMDEKDCDKYQRQIDELRSENEMLISQIKEQKICEDENQLLKDELKILEEEKEAVLEKVTACKEYEQNYKALIVEIESLKSEKEKLERNQFEPDRIFTPEITQNVSTHTLENIKEDVLHLREEIQKIKDEKTALQEEIKRLRKKLFQKKKALQECKQKMKDPDKTVEKKPEHEIDELYDMANKIDNLSEDFEIKSLTQLIKETLNDIKK